jgi:hypothetical protein
MTSNCVANIRDGDTAGRPGMASVIQPDTFCSYVLSHFAAIHPSFDVWR